ncbi:hypothetical protein DFI_06930 [Deinococcus ficus]|uniref:Uncharacterized protein n=1 Tax=Deinococcus ficus TaxID=317577 RepID=A0A221SVY3_9DEIO|nr:hypothetical protein DFI_06930 [Deinococcus ficus]
MEQAAQGEAGTFGAWGAELAGVAVALRFVAELLGSFDTVLKGLDVHVLSLRAGARWAVWSARLHVWCPKGALRGMR